LTFSKNVKNLDVNR